MDDTDIFPEGIQPLLGFDGVDRQSGSLFVTSCWWKNCGSPYRCSVHCCRQVCWLYSIGSFCAPSFRAFFISRRLRRLGFHPRQIHLRPGTGPVAGSNTLPWRMKLSASWSALPTWDGYRPTPRQPGMLLESRMICPGKTGMMSFQAERLLVAALQDVPPAQ